MKLTYQKQVSLSKLNDELIVANTPLENGEASPVQATENEVYIFVPDGTPQEVIDQITDIVTNHDPTPLPPKPGLENYLLELDFRISLLELGVV